MDRKNEQLLKNEQTYNLFIYCTSKMANLIQTFIRNVNKQVILMTKRSASLKDRYF